MAVAVPVPLVVITGLLVLVMALVVVPFMVAKQRAQLARDVDLAFEEHARSRERVMRSLHTEQHTLISQDPKATTLAADAHNLQNQVAELQRAMNEVLVSASETLRQVEAAYKQAADYAALRQDASIGGLLAKVQGLSTEVGALTQKLATVQTDTGVSVDRIRSVRGDLEQIQAGLASVEKDVQSRVNAYGPAYRSVRAAVTNQLATARNLGDDLNTTRKRVDDSIAVLDAFLATQQGLMSNVAMDLNVDRKQLAVKGRLCVKDTDSTMLCVDKDALRQVIAPIDCKVSEFSPWTICDAACGGGQQTRTRSTLRQPSNGGAPCPQLKESQSCNTQPCPVDCLVSMWSEWSACSKSCGGGTRTRTRPILRPAANGGASCPALTETETCNTQSCPVDCTVTAWSNWSSCNKTCGGGTQTRTRSVLRQAANGGAACPTEMSQSQSCNTQACPADCQVSDWSSWSSCDKSCGGGTQTRTRSVLRQAANGGAACPTEMSQSQSCNTQACPVSSGSTGSTNTLFSFSSHVFTNAGATGTTGPSIQQVRSAYSSASWAQSSQYLSMNTQGIQRWTVPATGSYRITAVGAKGGSTSSYTGGAGASVTGTFTLTQGQILDILVGQAGTSYTYTAGGGGGSFVVRDGQALLVAGGGGGAGDSGGHGKPAQATSTDGSVGHPNYAAGTNGNASTQSSNGGWGTSGAGFKGDSISELAYGIGSNAKSFANGGIGAGPGNNSSCGGSPGGFGGGGGGGCNGGGGGGGYSGGGAGGGGGGSFNGGSNPSSSTSSTGHGSVTIELLNSSSSSSSGVSVNVEGKGLIQTTCTQGDHRCQAQQVCEKVTGEPCIHQQYDCGTGSSGSWYPQSGSGSSTFNFAYAYDLYGGNYGNICACDTSAMSKYGLASNHTYCGLGRWHRV